LTLLCGFREDFWNARGRFVIYAFGDFRLDEEALELRGPDGVVAAEPRVLETLIYLVRNPGRVLSKDELAARVWEGAHITDSTIARSVMRARRAIGDDAARPMAIRTVHGRGYRFDLPVEELESPDSAPVHPLRRVVPTLALAAAVTALVVLAVTWWRSGSVVGSGVAERSPLELRVESPPDDDELQLVALSMTEELRRSLDRISQGGEGTAVGGGDLLRVRLAPGDIEGNALVEAVLEPGGAGNGAGSAEAPILLARHQIPYRLPTVGADRFLGVRNAITRRIVQRLEAARQPSAPGLDAEEEALHLFLQATAEWAVACDGLVAAEQLRRSLELDPNSASAWYMLALAYWSQLSLCSGEIRLLDEAERALDRAIELDPQRPLYRQLRAGFLVYRGRVEEAYALLGELAAEAPDHLFVEMGLSEALRYAGFLGPSRRVYEEALEEHPGASLLYDFFVPYPYLYEGEWEPVLRLLPGGGSPYLRYFRGYAEWRLGHDEAAQRALEPAFLDHPGDTFARLCQALLARLRGAPEESKLMLEQLVRQRREKGSGDGEVSFKIGELLVLAGAADEGLDQLARAVEQGFFCPRCLVSSPALEPLADDPRFQSLLTAAEARHRRFARRFGLAPELPAPRGSFRRR
jgi:DNA-binding winged helix-turn-helix (wHTH) protein/tetratricopeptide (TPR) repeat protein